MGRYGIDELTQALMLLGCGFVLVNFFAHSSILSTLALLLMALGIFRCYSRNIAARARELAKYQDVMVKPKAWWRLLNKKWVNRKTTIYFKCKGCGAVLNVPKGKGRFSSPVQNAAQKKRSVRSLMLPYGHGGYHVIYIMCSYLFLYTTYGMHAAQK